MPARIFASERLLWAQPAARRGQGRALHGAPRMQRLIYQVPKPRPDGQTLLPLTPMEFFERLATLIRRHAGTVTAITASWPRMLRCVRR